MTERREDIALELARKLHARHCPYEHANGVCDLTIEADAALLRPHVWEWIPVGERLPTLGQPVLVLTTPSRHCFVMQLDNDRSWIDPDSDVIGSDVRLHGYDVTHWAALPSAPLSLESSDQK